MSCPILDKALVIKPDTLPAKQRALVLNVIASPDSYTKEQVVLQLGTLMVHYNKQCIDMRTLLLRLKWMRNIFLKWRVKFSGMKLVDKPSRSEV